MQQGELQPIYLNFYVVFVEWGNEAFYGGVIRTSSYYTISWVSFGAIALQLASDDVSPIPKLARETRQTRGRKRQHSTVLTASPLRKILAEKLKKKKQNNNEGQLKKKEPTAKGKSKN